MAPAAQIPTDQPIFFFTNVAGRLLRSELNLDLNLIQIYPTNQYTPAVHRLLQVTANLYDSTTNRQFGSTGYPYCPSVFRPLFRRTATGTILIVGYREVAGTALASAAAGPQLVSLENATSSMSPIPPLGMAPAPSERQEPLIASVPLVIGARKGFPNFNELSVQTYASISRLLEFRRENLAGPVTLTNQMYTLMLSNIFGVEVWNSYSNAYPRNLQLTATVKLTAVITNLSDGGQGFTLLSNRVVQGLVTNIPAGLWQGWASLGQEKVSFRLPFGNTNNYVFTNASYLDQPPWFEPLTHVFPRSTNFYEPHWWLNLRIGLQYILVDIDAQRIVDYVNLDYWEPTLNLTAKLAEGADCSGSPSSLTDPAAQWCTNRVLSGDPSTPTRGLQNQIAVGLGVGSPDSRSFLLDPYAGRDVESAVDGFRYNLMGWGPIYPKDFGQTFYRSNVFYAPFNPYRPIYVHTFWQANDPLVHYLIDDLLDPAMLSESNRANFFSMYPPLPNLGQINDRYEPWGGNPYKASGLMPPSQVAAKDPMVHRSDDWDFPTNQPLGVSWLGKVHRGTPWQTLFLKSTNILLQTGSPTQDLWAWQRWTGNVQTRQDESDPGAWIPDALFTAPTNDWQLVSRLAPLFKTNDVRSLASVNQTGPQAWAALLDGLTVLTNPTPGQFDTVIISSNSPLAAVVGQALESTRLTQPHQFFARVGDILATPELSVASPWLSTSNSTLNERACEILPAQLLALLRPDSFGWVSSTPSNAPAAITFTGFDDYSYAVETSSNLLDWTPLGSYYPTNGLIRVSGTAAPSLQFYRSVLVP